MTSRTDVRDGAASAGASVGRATIVGTGLIGGSVGLALRSRGWHVSGTDTDAGRADRARELGALDAVGDDPDADLVVVATPVAAVASEAAARIDAGPPHRVVTDVAGVKASIVATVDHPRFVGGHPMAGSEQLGVDGADASLFEGATWVLTPTSGTDPSAYARVHSLVTSLGADALAIGPADHDTLVAMVSHVPHLTAATLMSLAAARAEEHAQLLRLAAGGFRDMTRIAAGHPGIWPDICTANRPAIVETLDRLIASLDATRALVAAGDRPGLLALLERAHIARRNLPSGVPRPEDLVEMRVPVRDRPGALAEVLVLASDLGVNVFDVSIAHSAEGERGILLLVVDARASDLMRGGLMARGFRPSVHPL